MKILFIVLFIATALFAQNFDIDYLGREISEFRNLEYKAYVKKHTRSQNDSTLTGSETWTFNKWNDPMLRNFHSFGHYEELSLYFQAGVEDTVCKVIKFVSFFDDSVRWEDSLGVEDTLFCYGEEDSSFAMFDRMLKSIDPNFEINRAGWRHPNGCETCPTQTQSTVGDIDINFLLYENYPYKIGNRYFSQFVYMQIIYRGETKSPVMQIPGKISVFN